MQQAWLLELRALQCAGGRLRSPPLRLDYFFVLASSRLFKWSIRYGRVFAISGSASPSFLGVPPRWYVVRPSRKTSNASSGRSTILN
jgi:hypothetical protein